MRISIFLFLVRLVEATSQSGLPIESPPKKIQYDGRGYKLRKAYGTADLFPQTGELFYEAENPFELPKKSIFTQKWFANETIESPLAGILSAYCKISDSPYYPHVISNQTKYSSSTYLLEQSVSFAVEGDSIDSFRLKRTAPSESRVVMAKMLDYFSQAVLAIHELHARGLLHLQLQTQHIYLGPDGAVKILGSLMVNISELTAIGARSDRAIEHSSPRYLYQVGEQTVTVGHFVDIASLLIAFKQTFATFALFSHNSQSDIDQKIYAGPLEILSSTGSFLEKEENFERIKDSKTLLSFLATVFVYFDEDIRFLPAVEEVMRLGATNPTPLPSFLKNLLEKQYISPTVDLPARDDFTLSRDVPNESAVEAENLIEPTPFELDDSTSDDVSFISARRASSALLSHITSHAFNANQQSLFTRAENKTIQLVYNTINKSLGSISSGTLRPDLEKVHLVSIFWRYSPKGVFYGDSIVPFPAKLLDTSHIPFISRNDSIRVNMNASLLHHLFNALKTKYPELQPAEVVCIALLMLFFTVFKGIPVLSSSEIEAMRAESRMKILNGIAVLNSIQSADIYPKCLGRAVNGQDSTFYILIDSPRIQALKNELFRGVKDYDVDLASRFNINQDFYFGIGYIGRELGVTDGVWRHSGTCIMGLDIY